MVAPVTAEPERGRGVEITKAGAMETGSAASEARTRNYGGGGKPQMAILNRVNLFAQVEAKRAQLAVQGISRRGSGVGRRDDETRANMLPESVVRDQKSDDISPLKRPADAGGRSAVRS